MKVWVPQAPKGAEALSLVLHFDLPRKRVMFVLTLVSSNRRPHGVWGLRADSAPVSPYT